MIRIPIANESPIHPRMARFMAYAASQGEDVDFIESNLGIAANRNRACSQLLSSAEEYLWMIDSDVIPPGLLRGDDRCISGVYHHYMGGVPEITYSVWVKKPGGLYSGVIELPPVRFIAPAVAAGCLRIHRSLLEEIGNPWFEDHMNDDGTVKLGEDLDFSQKVCAVGEKIWVEPDFLCHHLKTVSIKTFLRCNMLEGVS